MRRNRLTSFENRSRGTSLDGERERERKIMEHSVQSNKLSLLQSCEEETVKQNRVYRLRNVWDIIVEVYGFSVSALLNSQGNFQTWRRIRLRWPRSGQGPRGIRPFHLHIFSITLSRNKCVVLQYQEVPRGRSKMSSHYTLLLSSLGVYFILHTEVIQ